MVAAANARAQEVVSVAALYEYSEALLKGYALRYSRALANDSAWLQRRREPFRCYWQAANGCLAPASPPCWVAAFEIRKMSNLVSVSYTHLTLPTKA